MEALLDHGNRRLHGERSPSMNAPWLPKHGEDHDHEDRDQDQKSDHATIVPLDRPQGALSGLAHRQTRAPVLQDEGCGVSPVTPEVPSGPRSAA